MDPSFGKTGKLGQSDGNGMEGAGKAKAIKIGKLSIMPGDEQGWENAKAQALKTGKINGLDVRTPAGKEKLLSFELQIKNPGLSGMDADQIARKQLAKAGNGQGRTPGDQGEPGKGGTGPDGRPLTQGGQPDHRFEDRGQGDVKDPQHDARLKSVKGQDPTWQESHSQHGQGRVIDPDADARTGSNKAAKAKVGMKNGNGGEQGKAGRGMGRQPATAGR